MGTSPAELVDRVRRFLLEDLWREDFGTRGIAGAPLRALQLGALIVRGFVDDKLLLRASALTYMTSLAIIPVLVVVLSIIQWLGLSRDLVILGVNQFLAGSPDAIDRIMAFVDTADVGALGSLGGAVFLGTTILSLRHVEETFNDIWGALHGRSWVRRFTNYLAVLVVVPLVAGSLFSLSTDLALGELADGLLLTGWMEAAQGTFAGAAPAGFLLVAFTLGYVLLPNTKVRVVSALLGAVVAAVLFIVAQRLYVSFSVGAARYDALFGGFAFLPLMLVWIYVSWSIVLLGAEIAYAHQHLALYRREARDRGMQPAEREAVGLRVIVEIARCFRDGWPAQTGEQLAERLGSSPRVVNELLVRLVAARIVSVSGDADAEKAFQLGQAAEAVEIGRVLAAIRGPRADEPAWVAGDTAVRNTMHRVEQLLVDADGAMRDVGQQTLADLVADLPPESA